MDLVALQYACMINGVTQVIMTKADVLDAFEDLSICTAYKIDSKETAQVPFQMTRYPIEPLYTPFKGWNQETSGITEEAALPKQMKDYIQFINTKLGVPVRYISNGPGRDQIIK